MDPNLLIIELYERRRREHRRTYYGFRVLRVGNDEIVAPSEQYTTRRAREATVALFQAYGIPVRAEAATSRRRR